MFYSGFAATAAWICWLVWRNRGGTRPTFAAVPVGYGLAVGALPVFALAGAGDYAWHTVFGIEQELRILFSPTHLVLVTSMILIITSPLRSAWADERLPASPSMRQLMPSVLAVAFATSLVLLFLQYANALVWSPGDVVAALSNPLDGSRPFDWASPVELMSSIAVTNVVLLAPLLLLATRWRVPVGTATIIYAAVAGSGRGHQRPADPSHPDGRARSGRRGGRADRVVATIAVAAHRLSGVRRARSVADVDGVPGVCRRSRLGPFPPSSSTGPAFPWSSRCSASRWAYCARHEQPEKHVRGN